MLHEAGAYRVPVPVPKMNFRFFGTGQVQTSAPYRIRKCVPSLNFNSGVTRFWDEKSHPRNTPISRTKKTRPKIHIESSRVNPQGLSGREIKMTLLFLSMWHFGKPP